MREGLKIMDIALEPGAEALLFSFYEFFAREAAVLNLTAITHPAEVAIKHFIDSLALLKWASFSPGERLLDVGSGAGFPGIPLGIAVRGLRIVLLEAVNKKAEFQEKVAVALQLKNIEVLSGRAEYYGRAVEYREKFDWVVARAVAPLRELAEYTLPFVRVGGTFVAFKGPKGKEETVHAVKAISILGGQMASIKEYRLPLTGDRRLLLFINKTKHTPDAYPRRPGIPRRKPL